MSGHSTYVPKSAIGRWFESRLPVIGLIHSSFVAYPTPRNLNYFWTFGGILSMMLASQIITGVVLVMHYTPDANLAYASIDNLDRNVNYGWLLHNWHSVGATMFFLAVYIHMFRGMYYGSYKAPREILWILGVIIYLLMMGAGFIGYVLVWGGMSAGGAKVITTIPTAFPLVGQYISTWLWGDFAPGPVLLNRFLSLHYLLPFMIAGVVVLHIWALHVVGQNNPDGVEVSNVGKDTVPFTPYATIKDSFGMICFLVLFAYVIFYIPGIVQDPDNYYQAVPGKTPPEIVPEWYFLPFYAMLRSIDFDLHLLIVTIPGKLLGVITMVSSIVILAFLPWLDTSKVKSAKYRPTYRFLFWIFVLVCIGLGYLGSQQPTEGLKLIARFFTAWYFLHFLVFLPLLGIFEKTKPVPASIADAILAKNGKTAEA